MTSNAHPDPVVVFSGFPEGKVRQIPVPEQFFTELLGMVQDPAELKLSLYAFWYLYQQEGQNQYLTADLLENDNALVSALEVGGISGGEAVQRALTLCVTRGFLLEREGAAHGKLYFLNAPNGRRLADAFTRGLWSPGEISAADVQLEDRPDIFTLYEQNIGPLTPMVAEIIKDTLSEYPQRWIADALEIAVKNNARNWRYVEAILKSWQEQGRHDTNRRDKEDDYKRFTSGEYSDLIER